MTLFGHIAARSGRTTGVVLALLIGGSALAQAYKPLPSIAPTAESSSAKDAYLEAGITPKPGAKLDLNLRFRDELGREVRLGDLFAAGKPVVLQLGYFECPSLCGEVLRGMLKSFKEMQPSLYTDFHAISISIDPKETPSLAAQKRLTFTRDYGRPNAEAGWHFLVGDKASIDAVASTVGFDYRYDKSIGQYAHGGGIMVLTPEGVTSAYLGGIDYPAAELADALQTAGQSKVSSKVTEFLRMLCYHYDPVTNTYSLAIMKLLRLGGLGIVVLIASAVLVMVWLERRKRLTTQDEMLLHH